MGFILDSIRLKEILENSETINVDWTSPSFSLDDREDEFSIMVTYANGVSPNVTLILQLSSDNINFADLTESFQGVTDASGSHMWDVNGSGALYARVKIAVTSGSLDVTRIFYAGKQRH
jgi:hypothetical protein